MSIESRCFIYNFSQVLNDFSFNALLLKFNFFPSLKYGMAVTLPYLEFIDFTQAMGISAW